MIYDSFRLYKQCSSCYFARDDTNAPCERCNMGDMYLEQGIKFSKDKADWTLLPWTEMQEVIDVLEFGAKKYSRDNWQKVSKEEYKKALLRHVISYTNGEMKDTESDKSHLAHAICNCLFIMWKDKNA